ncbi:MAG: hypothetical protein M3N52_07965, partial [Actinomycetota bacterium]|nr:hypothetical protein [Actinomycetota bacterium]
LDDVLDAIGVRAEGTGGPVQARPDDLEPGAAAVLDLLGPVPATPGALAVHSGRSVAQILAAVGELTARGLAQATPAGVVRASG